MELQRAFTFTLGFSDDVAGQPRHRHLILSGNSLAIHPRLGLGEVHDGTLGFSIKAGWPLVYGF